MPFVPPLSAAKCRKPQAQAQKESNNVANPKASARPVFLCVSNQTNESNKPSLVEFLSLLPTKKKQEGQKKVSREKGDASTGGVARRYKLTPTKWLAQNRKIQLEYTHPELGRPQAQRYQPGRASTAASLPVPCAWGGRPGDGRVICREMQVAGLGKLVCTGGSCQGWVSGRLVVLCCSVLCCRKE